MEILIVQEEESVDTAVAGYARGYTSVPARK